MLPCWNFVYEPTELGKMNNSQTELERLEQSGNEHYGRKEYSIAVECYRAALEHGMNAHSPLFNFGYALAETGNHIEAVIVYQKAIAAGSGTSAHNNLGCSLQNLGQHQEARDAFRKAAQLEPSNALYCRNLASRLSHLKEQAAELKAREILVTCRGCTSTDWNDLGRVKEREKDFEGALLAFRNAAYQNSEECAFFFNVALMNERLGRGLDAYHACRKSLMINRSYQDALKMMTRLENTLKKKPTAVPPVSNREYKFVCPHCNQSISATGAFAETEVQCPTCAKSFTTPPWPSKPIEIGPHDYVNPYVILNLAQTHEQPEAYEWFNQPNEWEKLLGSLTRRRRALKAELELNDGALGWLPELSITDEVVHRVLADLDDDGWHANHWAVFRMPTLKRFLMFGDLDYFYSQTHAPYPLLAEIAGADTDDWEHEDFIEFISPFFSHRLAVAIKISLDSANYEAAIALFATRLPLTATDYDEAIEPVRRHFARRREILGALESKLEHGTVKNTGKELEHWSNEAKLLNILPAQHGAKLREDMCRSYRSISIALANHLNDYTASELALKAAEHFDVSETTKERLAGDRTMVKGLIQREKEQIQREEEHKQARKKTEKQYTLRLTLKRWFRERVLEITPERFCWGEDNISVGKLAGIRFGIDAGGSNSILAVHDIDGRVVTTDWLGDNNFTPAISSVMALYSPIILEKMLNTINSGGSVTIGLATLNKKGITVTNGGTNKWGNPLTSSCQWNQASAEMISGQIRLKSNTLSSDIYSESFSIIDVDFTVVISCRDCWNACLLPYLIKIMKSVTR